MNVNEDKPIITQQQKQWSLLGECAQLIEIMKCAVNRHLPDDVWPYAKMVPLKPFTDA